MAALCCPRHMQTLMWAGVDGSRDRQLSTFSLGTRGRPCRPLLLRLVSVCVSAERHQRDSLGRSGRQQASGLLIRGCRSQGVFGALVLEPMMLSHRPEQGAPWVLLQLQAPLCHMGPARWWGRGC